MHKESHDIDITDLGEIKRFKLTDSRIKTLDYIKIKCGSTRLLV